MWRYPSDVIYLSDMVLLASAPTEGGCRPAGNDTFLDTRGAAAIVACLIFTHYWDHLFYTLLHPRLTFRFTREFASLHLLSYSINWSNLLKLITLIVRKTQLYWEDPRVNSNMPSITHARSTKYNVSLIPILNHASKLIYPTNATWMKKKNIYKS